MDNLHNERKVLNDPFKRNSNERKGFTKFDSDYDKKETLQQWADRNLSNGR